MMYKFFLLLLSLQSAWDEVVALVNSIAFPLVLSNLIVIGFFIYLYWYDREEQNKYEGRIAQLEDSSKRATKAIKKWNKKFKKKLRSF